MAASEHSAQIREALRRLLPRSQSTQSAAGGLDASTAQSLETKIADAFKRYPFFPRFKLIEDASFIAIQSSAKDMIDFVYELDLPEVEAWIELPISLVKATFSGALGGAFSIQSKPKQESLTAAERRFAEFLARELCPVVAPPGRVATLNRIIHPDSADRSEKPNNSQQYRLTAKSEQTQTSLNIYLPEPQRVKDRGSSNGTVIAEAASRMVVAPEVRLQLRAMTLSQVAALKCGDIIDANAENAGAAGQILVGENAIFACELGQIGNRYSARVREMIAGSANARIDGPNGWVR